MSLVDSVSVIRNLKSEIPNITGSLRSAVWENSCSGAFYEYYVGGTVLTIDSNLGHDSIIGYDASLVTNRYGDYTEVNPLYESTLICIRY